MRFRMRELIAAPLIAAAEAQQELAATAWNFYQQIAFDGKSGNKARILEFDVERPIQQDGKMTTMSQSVKAPFIGLVPIPSLLIDRVDVDFQMEVTDTSNVKSTTNAEVEAKASAKHWFINAEISGKVTTARENTRMTNQTAKSSTVKISAFLKTANAFSLSASVMTSLPKRSIFRNRRERKSPSAGFWTRHPFLPNTTSRMFTLRR